MIECSAQYLVTLLVTDTFLAKLLASIGISDSLTGIISSFVSLAFMVQLLSVFLVKLKFNAKTLVIFFDTVSIFFFMLLYLIPFFSISTGAKSILVMICIVIAYAANALIFPISFKWANSYVNPAKRASYSASKEILSLFSGMIFSIVMGYAIDQYEKCGKLNAGFLFLAITILALNICNFVCYWLIKKDTVIQETEEKESFLTVLKHIMSNKKFRSIIVQAILLNIASGFTIGFIGVFKMKNLMMSVLMVQVVNVIANLFRICVSKPIGRFSDKYSFEKGYKLGLYLAAGAYLAIVFTTRSTWFLIIIHTVLYSCSMAGTNQNAYNITYNYVEDKYITQAMAFKFSVSGIFGFGTSILAGKILSCIQAGEIQFCGIQIYGQQILAAFSFLVILVTIFYTDVVIEKN